MPDFPTDVKAFTCRLRRGEASRWRVVFAPAGGLGWSKPCCEDGHDTEGEASTHGGSVLTFLLGRTSQPATLS